MTAQVISKMIEYFASDVARINHSIKVYGFASCIAKQELLMNDDLLIVEIAALLHDIGIVEAERKYNSTAGNYQEKEGPELVRLLLSDININPTILDRICFIVGNHHSYNKIDGIDFQIIVEADFLVNIFEESILQKSIKNIHNKYFKTHSGAYLLEKMYF